MSEESASPKARAGREPAVPARRRLSLPARLRAAAREAADRLLAADLLWSVLLVGVVTALLALGSPTSERLPALGAVLDHDVVARKESGIPDARETEARRREAAEAVPDVYLHDRARGDRLAEKVRSLFDSGRQALGSGESEGRARGAATARKALPGMMRDAEIDALLRLGFSAEVERDLAGILRGVMENPIVANKALLASSPGVLLVHAPGGSEERLSEAGSVLDLDEARRRARAAVEASRAFPPDSRETLANLVAAFVDVNVAYDPEATALKRDAASAAVPPVVRTVPAGTVVARAGEKVAVETLLRIEAARGGPRGRVGLPGLAGTVFIASLLAFFLRRYTRYHQRAFKRVQHLHALLALVLLSMLLLSRAMIWIAKGLVDNLSPPFNDPSSYTYLIPLAGGSILVALLATGRISMVYSGFTALLFAAMNGWNTFAMTWALLVQWAGIYAIATYRERAALLRAGLVAGVAGAASALAVAAVRDGLAPISRGVYEAGLAFVGGAVGTGLFVSFALPLLEGLFKVLTDIRLLELSNLNQPLLAEFAVKAPGSYNHSLVLATLAEDAARTIGANALYCRVAAFYHDIGKIRKPEYFVENQHGTNPHDRLSPSMSALIITAHVKDGIRLAREAGLPQQIVDVVPQHHGTRLMTYFYDKARKTADPSLGPVSEADFRYPGPKPQTKETAIFMLADGVEAAARTLDEPTPGRLGELIHKITSAIVLDGQLDECDLTFADLERIEQAFLRTLTSMYHHRVDYPGFEFGRPRPNGRTGGAAQDRRAARSASR
ncbi:MAG: HDIG domain-containing protein [Acidobacteriia bacterium]|nr:HDIG domain-containing protein [Terriglobia bacterium]